MSSNKITWDLPSAAPRIMIPSRFSAGAEASRSHPAPAPGGGPGNGRQGHPGNQPPTPRQQPLKSVQNAAAAATPSNGTTAAAPNQANQQQDSSALEEWDFPSSFNKMNKKKKPKPPKEPLSKKLLNFLRPDGKKAPEQVLKAAVIQGVYEKSFHLAELALATVLCCGVLFSFVAIFGKMLDMYSPVFAIMGFTGLFTSVPSGLLYFRVSEEVGVLTFAGTQIFSGLVMMYAVTRPFIDGNESSVAGKSSYGIMLCAAVQFFYAIISCWFPYRTMSAKRLTKIVMDAFAKRMRNLTRTDKADVMTQPSTSSIFTAEIGSSVAAPATTASIGKRRRLSPAAPSTATSVRSRPTEESEFIKALVKACSAYPAAAAYTASEDSFFRCPPSSSGVGPSVSQMSSQSTAITRPHVVFRDAETEGQRTADSNNNNTSFPGGYMMHTPSDAGSFNAEHAGGTPVRFPQNAPRYVIGRGSPSSGGVATHLQPQQSVYVSPNLN